MRIWESFPKLFAAVRASHDEVGLVGHHDWVHAARVGELAYQIALDEWHNDYSAKMAGVAGLCHNADRVLQKRLGVGRRDVPKMEVVELVRAWIFTDATGHPWKDRYDLIPFEKSGVREIVDAVLGHDGRNGEQDSRTLIALMDADRLVSLDGDLFARSGQYYHDLPVVDYKRFPGFDPEATYRNPKTVFRDIAYSLDWVDPASPVCIRTRLGKTMGARRAKVFRQVMDAIRNQLEEEGILPYGFD